MRTTLPTEQEQAPKKIGRPTLLTPALQQTIIKHIRNGNYISIAAQACGVCKDTLFHWMQWGEDAIASGNGEEDVYAVFFRAAKKAEAEAEAEDLAYIRSSKYGWQARAWIRERKDPERWAQKVRPSAESEALAQGLAFLAKLMQIGPSASSSEVIEGRVKVLPSSVSSPSLQEGKRT